MINLNGSILKTIYPWQLLTPKVSNKSAISCSKKKENCLYAKQRANFYSKLKLLWIIRFCLKINLQFLLVISKPCKEIMLQEILLDKFSLATKILKNWIAAVLILLFITVNFFRTWVSTPKVWSKFKFLSWMKNFWFQIVQIKTQQNSFHYWLKVALQAAIFITQFPQF